MATRGPTTGSPPGLWTNNDPFTVANSPDAASEQDMSSNRRISFADTIGNNRSNTYERNSDGDDTACKKYLTEPCAAGGTDDPEFKKHKTESDARLPEDEGQQQTPKQRKLHFANVQAGGPTRFFNPTSVRMDLRWSEDDDGTARDGTPPDRPVHPRGDSDMAYIWRSRDNRKGRNSLALAKTHSNTRTAMAYPNPPYRKLKFSSSFAETCKGIWKMFSTFPYWDMAFWSGLSYTIGSILFVLDGAFSWSETAWPSDEFSDEENAIGYLFFVGALCYEVGATMAWWEAVNDGTFQGSAMRRFVDGRDDYQKKLLDDKIVNFFGKVTHKKTMDEEKADYWSGFTMNDERQRRGSRFGATCPRRGGIDLGDAGEGESSTYLTWRWFPTWKGLVTHHIYEIGFVACSIQWIGATLYAMCGIVAIPGIIDSLQPWQENLAYWIPQIVASVCFLTAALLFTIETQEKWWKPEWKILGWWIGVWAAVGSMGFLLCGCFGPASFFHHWAAYQSDLSSLWGSVGYLISSLLQWYEAVNKNTVEELLNEPGDLKSSEVHPI